jgi:hypothetical protein
MALSVGCGGTQSANELADGAADTGVDTERDATFPMDGGPLDAPSDVTTADSESMDSSKMDAPVDGPPDTGPKDTGTETASTEWARGLTSDDTIVSFNYDRVVEKLGDAVRHGSITTVLPGRHAMSPIGCGCRLLKLHGSVDWKKRRDEKGEFMAIEMADELHALDCDASELAIATPGPSKRRESKDFESIWSIACQELMAADAIVFIGYRFPETDAYARSALLGAIRKHKALNGDNAGPSDRLSIHAVLGLKGPASERLESMLEFVCQRGRKDKYRVKSHPLYGQDFLSLVERERLDRIH